MKHFGTHFFDAKQFEIQRLEVVCESSLPSGEQVLTKLADNKFSVSFSTNFFDMR
jgi:hypothetical protein